MGWLRGIVGLVCLAAVVLGTMAYPAGAPALAAALVGYGLALWRWPLLWLAVVPLCLPVLDLSPFTGRLLLDEFDLILLTTLAVRGFRREEEVCRTWPNRLFPAALALLWASWATAMARGLWPLLHEPAGLAPASHTPLEAWWVGKGLLWALLLVPGLRQIPPPRREKAMRLFLAGLVAGLVLLSLAVLWERQTFVGWLDFENVFRATGSFSNMHTGGAYIEAFIAFAFPALAVWTTQRGTVAGRAFGVGAAALACYAMLVTFSRGGYGGLAAGLLVAALGVARQRHTGRARHRLVLAGVIAICVAVAVPVLSGGFARARLARVGEDLAVRLAHWKRALSLMDRGVTAGAVGQGFGTYPTLYRQRAGAPVAPGSYRVLSEGSNTYLWLGGGESVYLDQFVSVRGQQALTLAARVRRPARQGSLEVALCEKALLTSFDCIWQHLEPTGYGTGWETLVTEVDTGALGVDGNWFNTPPAKLSLYNPSRQHPIEVDDVSLKTRAGEELVANGDFGQGADRWLFVTDQDLAWHIHQQWVETFFAQGWLGVVAVVLLLVSVGAVLRPAWSAGDLCAIALVGSLAAFLAVGMLGSTVDTARLSLLFYLGCFMGGMLCADYTAQASP